MPFKKISLKVVTCAGVMIGFGSVCRTIGGYKATILMDYPGYRIYTDDDDLAKTRPQMVVNVDRQIDMLQ